MRTFPYISDKNTVLPISIDDAKKWLRMDIDGFNGEDFAIEQSIKGAFSQIESRCDLSTVIDTYTWYTHCFPCVIPTRFVTEIESISYLDDNDDYQTITPDSYVVFKIGIMLSKIRYKVDLPPTTGTDDCVKIVFKAGFSTLPEALMKAARALIVEDFDGRNNSVQEKKTLADKLMDDFRVGHAG